MSMLAANYHVLELIARGSYGTITRCRHIKSGKFYAVKSQSDVQRMQKEVYVLKYLEDSVYFPNVYDSYHDKYMGWFAMDILVPINYHSLMCSYESMIRYLYDVTKALAELEARDLMHNDLSFSNVMSSRDNYTLIDFGLTGSPSSIGTPHFAAPEKFIGKLRPTSDIWSLGVLAFTLATGRYPFGEEGLKASFPARYVFEDILDSNIEKELSLWFPDDEQNQTLKQFILECVRHDPEERTTAKKLVSHALFATL